MRGTAAELGKRTGASTAKTPLDGIWRRFEGIKSPRKPRTVASGVCFRFLAGCEPKHHRRELKHVPEDVVQRCALGLQ